MKPGPKPSASAKRNDPAFTAGTWYLRTSTRDALQWAANASKLTDNPLDQSDILQAAVEQYLAGMTPQAAAKVHKAAHQRLTGATLPNIGGEQ